MKITSFFALGATALLALPAFAQETPSTPPAKQEDRIILLDDVDIETDIDVDIDPQAAAELERLMRSRVMVFDSMGEHFREFEMGMQDFEMGMQDFEVDMRNFEMDMNNMHFDFNAEEADSPEAEKRAELRDRYEDLHDEMRNIQRDLRQRQRELRAAKRSGSADTASIQSAIESAEKSLSSAQQSLETFQQQYGDQLGRTFFTRQAPVVRFRHNGADSNVRMRVPALPHLPRMPRMQNMDGIPPVPPMPPMAPLPRFNGDFSRGGNVLRFEGDTMIVRNGEGRRVIIIRDSSGNSSNVIVNGGSAGGGQVRVRTMTTTRNGAEGGSTVIINGDTLSNGGNAHVVIITRDGDDDDVTVENDRMEIENGVHEKPVSTTSPAPEYALQEAVPNPFTQRATISFSLPATAPVTLTVFNESGQVVRKLVDGEKSAGTHSIEFDGSDLPTGLYLYQLISGGYSQTKSMRLVK